MNRAIRMVGAGGAFIACVLHADVFEHVKEARSERFVLLYQLEIGDTFHYASKGVPYDVDRSEEIPADSFDRIAYYLELETAKGIEYVWVSFIPDVTDPSLLGVPNKKEHKRQRLIQGLHIESSEGSGVTPGAVDEGNIEFWNTNYGGSGKILSNFKDADHGFDDAPSGGVGYGSMQIHNYQARETLFAFNHWNGGGPADLGIGNSPKGATDWTFSKTSKNYERRLLQVLVRPRSRPGVKLDSFYLHVAGNVEYIGPIAYVEGSTIDFLDARFTISRIQDAGERSRFMIKSARTGKPYGPFDNQEGAAVNLGGLSFELSEWLRK